MTDDLSWNRALCVAGINLTKEERAAGWPAAFTPENLARLQYPWGGSALEKKAAHKNQSLLIATISKAIPNGGLPAVARTRTEDITESRQVPDFHAPSSPYSGGLGSSYWLNRDQAPPMRTVTKKIGERTVSYFVIERAAFRGWLVKQGLEPSEHVRAWFAARLAHDADTEEPHQDNAAATSERLLAQPKRPKVKLDYVKGVIDRVAAYCVERRIEFDRNSMPGKAADLLWVMERLYPDQFEGMLPKTFQDHYRGVCSWPRSAAHQDGARSIYLEVFPEARAQVAGVVPIYK